MGQSIIVRTLVYGRYVRNITAANSFTTRLITGLPSDHADRSLFDLTDCIEVAADQCLLGLVRASASPRTNWLTLVNGTNEWRVSPFT